jgi:uncharacterized protein
MTSVERVADAAALVAGAGHLLRASESLHSHLWALVARLQSTVFPPVDGPYLALVRDGDGQVAGCAAQVGQSPLSVSLLGDLAAAPALLADARDAGASVGQVLAPVAVARALAAAHKAAGGRPPTLYMAQRCFTCTEVTHPTGVPGHLRDPGEHDRPLLEEWVGAFTAEALHRDDPEGARRLVDTYLGRDPNRGLVLWDDGGPVAVAGFTGPTPTGITVLSVYTPPDRRRRGYASACTAALTQRLLDGGRRQVFLSTDLANPTSNRIYPAIGYRPDGDIEVYDLPVA